MVMTAHDVEYLSMCERERAVARVARRVVVARRTRYLATALRPDTTPDAERHWWRYQHALRLALG